MRFEIGRLLGTAVAVAALAAASACGGQAVPDASGGPLPGSPAPAGSPASAGGQDSKTICGSVMRARQAARDALAPASTALAKASPSADDIARATDLLKATFTAMHLDVAAAAVHAGDPELKAKLSVYQFSVEQAIVVVEGADGDRATLASAIELPEMRSAEEAVMAACS